MDEGKDNATVERQSMRLHDLRKTCCILFVLKINSSTAYACVLLPGFKHEDHTTNTPKKESRRCRASVDRSFSFLCHHSWKAFGAKAAGAFLQITWRIGTFFKMLKPEFEDIRGSRKREDRSVEIVRQM